jgi:THO complex subunit 3
MDISTILKPNDLFSAKGLVVVITGGGSGMSLLRLALYVHLP